MADIKKTIQDQQKLAQKVMDVKKDQMKEIPLMMAQITGFQKEMSNPNTNNDRKKELKDSIETLKDKIQLIRDPSKPAIQVGESEIVDEDGSAVGSGITTGSLGGFTTANGATKADSQSYIFRPKMGQMASRKGDIPSKKKKKKKIKEFVEFYNQE